MAYKIRTTWNWSVAIVFFLSVATLGTEALDLGVCQNTCSAVPEDLWPYCCETHHTCCEKFADSCILNCLPGVNNGDVSTVEERPALCCALYNLCCFRETARISSIRSDEINQPQSIPMTHRFSTLPGGPVKMSQSSVVLPDENQEVNRAPQSSQKPRTSNDNRRVGSSSSLKPTRKQSNTFKEARQSKVADDTQAQSTQFNENRRPNHRFNLRPQPSNKPDILQNSEPKPKETKENRRPQNSPSSSKLQINRPGISLKPLETSRTSNAPKVQEPVNEKVNVNKGKILERPNVRPFVRPGSTTNPLDSSQTKDLETKTEEQNNKQQSRLRKPSIQSRLIQLQPISETKPLDQTGAETTPVKAAKVIKPKPFVRPGPVVRLADTTEESELIVEVTEEPEEITTESPQRSQSFRLLRPNIKSLRIGDSTSRLNIEASNSDSSKISTKESSDDLDIKQESRTNAEPKITEEPEKRKTVRKIKRIRTREPTISTPTENTKEIPRDSDTTVSRRINIEEITEASASRSRPSRGRGRSSQTTTTSRPPTTQGRSRSPSQTTERRSQNNNKVNVSRPRSRSSTQTTQSRSRNTAQASRRRTNTQSRVTQKDTAGTTVAPRVRSRSQETNKQIETIQNPGNENKPSSSKENSQNSYLPLPKDDEMMKKVPEIITVLPTEIEEKIIKERMDAESNDTISIKQKSTKDPRNSPIKKIKLLRPRAETQTPSTQELKDVSDPEESPVTEKLQVQKTEEPSLSQNTKTKNIPEQSSRPQSTQAGKESSQSRTEQVTRKPSEPQVTIQRSQKETRRQPSTSQTNNSRSNQDQAPTSTRGSPRGKAQTNIRGSSRTQTQSTPRSRGRLTARQQLALANQS